MKPRCSFFSFSVLPSVPRLFCLWALPALLTVLCASPSFAQRGSETVLLVGVQRMGRLDSRLTHALYEALTSHGELLIGENALAPPERSCNNEECLSQLSSREGAKLAVAVTVQDTAGPSSPYLTVYVFDEALRTLTEERSGCPKCNPQQLGAALSDLSDQALRNYREKRAGQAAATAPAPTAPAAAPPAAPPPQTGEGTAPGLPLPPPPTTVGSSAPSPDSGVSVDFFSRWSPKRRMAAALLTGLLVAAVIPTVALQATDGSSTTLIGCSNPQGFCVLQNKPLWITGYSISGALAVGLAVTFLIPTSKPARPSQNVAMATEAK
jgi:hypothetical protein